MKRPERLYGWDFPDTIQVPDGYDMKSIPDLTRDSFQYLIDEHNNLVEVVNALVDHITRVDHQTAINFFGED